MTMSKYIIQMREVMLSNLLARAMTCHYYIIVVVDQFTFQVSLEVADLLVFGAIYMLLQSINCVLPPTRLPSVLLRLVTLSSSHHLRKNAQN